MAAFGGKAPRLAVLLDASGGVVVADGLLGLAPASTAGRATPRSPCIRDGAGFPRNGERPPGRRGSVLEDDGEIRAVFGGYASPFNRDPVFMNLDWNRPRDRRVLAVAALALLGALVAYAIQTKHDDGRGIGHPRSELPQAAAVQVPPAAAVLSAATVTVAPRTGRRP